MNLNHGAPPIDTLASWEDPQYGGVSPPPRKKLKRTTGAQEAEVQNSGDSSSSSSSSCGIELSNMQHQQEVANGTPSPQQNGNFAQTHSKVPVVNGVSEVPKPTVILDAANKEMVRIIGQHLTNLGFK